MVRMKFLPIWLISNALWPTAVGAGDSEISFITKEQAYTVGRKVPENTEAVYALQPDLVVASTATSSDLVRSLEGLGVPVYIARSPHNYQQMCEKIRGIAAAVGEKQQGELMVQKMDTHLQQLQKRLRRIPSSERRVAVAFNFTSAMGRRGDLLDSMLTMAHVINGAALLPMKTRVSMVCLLSARNRCTHKSGYFYAADLEL